MKEMGRLVLGILLFLGGSIIFAAGTYDLKEITPAVQTAVSNRQARYAALQQLKSEGAVGENNEGLTRVLRDSPQASALTSAENQDRETIYRAIADQNQLGSEGLERIRAVFAEVQRGKARPGEFIQLASGEWVQK